MIIPTIIIAFIAVALEICYRRSLIEKKRKIEEQEAVIDLLRNENRKFKAQIERRNAAPIMWIFGKSTFTRENFARMGLKECTRKALEDTLAETVFREYPNFIRDFVECRWQHTLDGQIEVCWQFKAQQKLVKDYE